MSRPGGMNWQAGIEGDHVLAQALHRLAFIQARRVVRQAINKACDPVVAAIETEAPVALGNAKRAITKKVVSYASAAKPGGAIVGLVGADASQAPHAHLVELGTGPRFHASGKYVGEMPANPFHRRGFEKSKAAAQQTLEEEMARGIEREAKRR